MYEATINYHGFLEYSLSVVQQDLLASVGIEPNQPYTKDLFAKTLSEPIHSSTEGRAHLDAMEAMRGPMISQARESAVDYVIFNKSP